MKGYGLVHNPVMIGFDKPEYPRRVLAFAVHTVIMSKMLNGFEFFLPAEKASEISHTVDEPDKQRGRHSDIVGRQNVSEYAQFGAFPSSSGHPEGHDVHGAEIHEQLILIILDERRIRLVLSQGTETAVVHRQARTQRASESGQGERGCRAAHHLSDVAAGYQGFAGYPAVQRIRESGYRTRLQPVQIAGFFVECPFQIDRQAPLRCGEYGSGPQFFEQFIIETGVFQIAFRRNYQRSVFFGGSIVQLVSGCIGVSGHQSFSQTRHRFHNHHLAVSAYRIGTEQDSGTIRPDHFLNYNRHSGFTGTSHVVFIGSQAFRLCRKQALPHSVLEMSRLHVQKGFILARRRCILSVFIGTRRAYRCQTAAQCGPGLLDSLGQAFGPGIQDYHGSGN